jgi:hypothetical protein
MKLFNKPSWLKPEINELIYYVHVTIIAIVVLGILQYFKGGEMLTLNNVLWSIPLITIGDILAHSILQLD